MASDSWLTWLPPMVLAPAIGSFLGVLIIRLPAHRPIGLTRSACDACGRMLAPVDLVPIASFVLGGGRCRTCHTPIAPMHLGVELAALGVAAVSCAILADPLVLWAGCALGWVLLALGWIDWRHMMLPDVLTLPLILAGLGATWLLQPDAITDHALAAAIGYLAFRLLALGYRTLRKRDGLGQGDAKLLAAGGAWAGLSALPVIVLGAAVGTLCCALFLKLRGARMEARTALPFGPALAAALWIVWLCAWADVPWLATTEDVLPPFHGAGSFPAPKMHPAAPLLRSCNGPGASR